MVSQSVAAGLLPKVSRKRAITTRLKYVFVDSPVKLPRQLAAFHQLSQLKEYVHSSGLSECPYFPARFELYEYLSANLTGEHAIDYLEFGVYHGKSMRKWVSLNGNADSRFIGFDTFEGLPEPWDYATGALEAGYFSTAGKTPEIDDPRVSFRKGLFQDTLAEFVRDFQPRNRLVVHCDADLYTSTLFVLATLDPFLEPGSIVIFDEFGSVNHEFRALMDYRASFRRSLAPIAWSGGFYENVAFVVDRG